MSNQQAILTPTELLAHWQGHRELTRRVIEAFPEEAFAQHHALEMRPFREMACELAGMVDYQLDWFRTGKPNWDESARPAELPSKAEILAWWDRQTPALEATVPEVTNEIWTTPVDTPFGRMSPLTSVLYLIDNEVHHQGQAYVYLRELGIQPPAFYERSSLPKMG